MAFGRPNCVVSVHDSFRTILFPTPSWRRHGSTRQCCMRACMLVWVRGRQCPATLLGNSMLLEGFRAWLAVGCAVHPDCQHRVPSTTYWVDKWPLAFSSAWWTRGCCCRPCVIMLCTHEPPLLMCAALACSWVVPAPVKPLVTVLVTHMHGCVGGCC